LDAGRVRVIGVCFGHQIVARALGARVAPSPGGWELSVTEVQLSKEGRRVFGGESLVSLIS
jgi:GMP synthase-like glutamine amidotransferase